MRLILAAIAIALLVLPAHAQRGHRHHGASQQKSANKPKVDEKAYSKALSTLPDQKYDPWNNMR
jgi:hypothetical protein